MTEPEPITDVDDFEVIAEQDQLLIACPNLPCEVRQTVAEDWFATVGDIIRAAREHQHRFPTPDSERNKTRD